MAMAQHRGRERPRLREALALFQHPPADPRAQARLVRDARARLTEWIGDEQRHALEAGDVGRARRWARLAPLVPRLTSALLDYAAVPADARGLKRRRLLGLPYANLDATERALLHDAIVLTGGAPSLQAACAACWRDEEVSRPLSAARRWLVDEFEFLPPDQEGRPRKGIQPGRPLKWARHQLIVELAAIYERASERPVRWEYAGRPRTGALIEWPRRQWGRQQLATELAASWKPATGRKAKAWKFTAKDGEPGGAFVDFATPLLRGVDPDLGADSPESPAPTIWRALELHRSATRA